MIVSRDKTQIGNIQIIGLIIAFIAAIAAICVVPEVRQLCGLEPSEKNPNEEIKEIHDPHPLVEKVSPDGGFNELTKEDIKQVFTEFIDAWNKKQYLRQISYLSSDFYYIDQKNEKEDYNSYIAKKDRLFKEYDWISVSVFNSIYHIDRDIGIVTYYQHYNSPKYESRGVNKLYFRKEGKQTKIFKEEFDRDNYNIK